MNKKKIIILIVAIVLIILGYFCFTYFIEEEKYSLSVMKSENVNGNSQSISYEKEVVKLLKKEGYKDNIMKTSKYSIHLSLTPFEVRKVKSIKFIKKYGLYMEKLDENNANGIQGGIPIPD